MNWFDALLIVVFMGVLALGFYAGLGRSLAAIVALLVALSAGEIFVHPVAVTLSSVFSTIPRWVAELLAFVIVTVLIGVAVLYVFIRSFQVAPLRTRRVIELRGGFPAIFLVAILAVLLSLMVVTTTAQASSWTARQMPIGDARSGLARQLDNSVLAEQALRLSPYLYRAVGALNPTDRETILRPVLRR